MFTGIVEATGKLLELQRLREGVRIHIQAPFHFFEDGLKNGDSIAINGVCLTVTAIEADDFWVYLSPETVEKTYLLNLPPGARVNLEKALRLSDRLGGHFVTGHVDGMAEVVGIEKKGEFLNYTFKLREKGPVISKGSIAMDGISLTINTCEEDTLETMVIPETLRKTTLGQKKIGDLVHVEFDMIGKYVKQYESIR